MSALVWVVIITSLIAGLASFAKGVFDLGIESVRGRMYALVGVGLFVQGAWFYFNMNTALWLLSRLFISLGTLQYILPYVLRRITAVSGIRWLIILLLWLPFLFITLLLVRGFHTTGPVGITVFVLDALTFFVAVWGTVGFWGAEVGYRWLGGSFVSALLWVGDAHIIKGLVFATYGIFTFMNVAMALVALKRG